MESDKSTAYSLKLRAAVAIRDGARAEYGKAVMAHDTDAAANAWIRWQSAAESLALLVVGGDSK